MIDPAGHIYEGVGWGVIGTHAANCNTGAGYGINFLGSYGSHKLVPFWSKKRQKWDTFARSVIPKTRADAKLPTVEALRAYDCLTRVNIMSFDPQ